MKHIFTLFFLLLFVFNEAFANEGGKILSNAFEGIFLTVLFVIGLIALFLLIMLFIKRKK